MKTWIQGILITVGITAGMIALGFGICAIEAKMDESVWNDGICQCGGEFTFSSADHLRNGGNLYYYTCNNCGEVIETHQPQTKPHKTYEVAGIVTEVNPETGCITLTDWDGEIWIFENENFKTGQLVIISFDNSGTDTVFDDKIIEVKG